jgi:site-specific recombinase XerD
MPSDSVVEWFDEPMAVRFIMTEIRTLGDLCERIRSKGYRWWGGIRQLGAVQGTRIVRWLAQHEATLGPLGAQAMSPVRAGAEKITREPETGIVPIESFSLPSVLDGSSGSNRALAKNRIPAQNDHQAIMAWLAARASNENTRRSYRREAERLLLWAILERGQALSSLDIEGGTEYRDWLAALGRTPPEAWRWRIPQERWIGKRNIPRWSPEWRPFDGALSLSSQRQAYTILKSMFEWLVKVRYLDSNPLDGVPPPQRVMGVATAPDLELTHAFTRSQWAFLMEYLHGQPMDESIRRLRFVLPFAYATGLRLAELVDARLGRLYSVPLKSCLGVRWMLKVLGKGGKWRAVPMPGMVMDSLRNYLASRGLNADPLDNPEDIPMIARLRLGQDTGTLDPTTLYKALKTFFRDAAAELAAQGHHDDAKKMAQASTHWLRHTRGAHSAETMPVNMIQRLLGHASVATTSIYTSTDDETLFLLLDDSLRIETQHGNRSAEWP